MKPAWTWTHLVVDLLGLGALGLGLGGLLELGGPAQAWVTFWIWVPFGLVSSLDLGPLYTWVLFGLGSSLDMATLWTWVPFDLTYLSKDSKVEIT